MRRWGIRARVLFVALAPSVLILSALVSYFTYAMIVEVDVALARQGVALARQLAPGAEFALFAGDRVALQHMADAAAKEANVIEVAIFDAAGQVLARGGRATTHTEDVLRFRQPVVQTQLPTPEVRDPPGVPAPALGEIAVAISRGAAHAEQQRLLMIGLVLGAACLALAVGLAAFIGNSVVRPVRELAEAMQTLGRGQPVAPLPLPGGGEFRTLAAGFNDMADRLQADTEALQRRIDAATRALKAQKEAAEQATTAKSRFLAAASHDLRQPLHAIGLFSATLERRARGTGLEPVVRDLAQAVAVMERLFESLLDIAKLDSGTIEVDAQPVPLARVCGQIEAEQADAARDKGLRLALRPGPHAVVGDELLLHRLLGNLVANAIRYTHAGTVLVACRPRGAFVRIEVRDSGIGIAADKQAEIFEEFYQVDNPARDRSRGLGLGLAIVARIARLLGTQVTVRSQPGCGSVFSLRLPRAYTAPAVDAGKVPADAETLEHGAALTVLVVDDDPLVLAGNRALLEELRCTVVTVTDGDAAVRALEALRGQPVLALCDLWLPKRESGVDVLRRLAALTDAPFSGIVISGDTRPETIQVVKAAGLTLLHKPLAASKLRALVMQFAWQVRAATGRRA
ncbi:MAG: response regulator [Burkholderiales bacterium]|nr:response regulator [Burkholderiales bacterium]